MRKLQVLVLFVGFCLIAWPSVLKSEEVSTQGSIGLTSPYALLGASIHETEILHGKAALAHLKNVKARRSRAFAAAVRKLEEQGLRPTETVTIVRSTSLVRKRDSSANPHMQFVQSTSDGSGELALWAWDDGNNATWEGVVHIEEYGTGSYSTWNTQIDISTGDFYVLWEQEVAYYPGSGGGGGDDGGGGPVTSLPAEAPVIQVASASPDQISSTLASRNGIELAGFWRSLYNWARCTVNGCAGSTLTCAMTGGGWGECVLASCAGTGLGCALAMM